MRSIIIGFSILILGLNVHAQTYGWSIAMGGLNWEIANSVAVDASGNRIVTGNFRDSLDIDPGPGVTLLTTTNDPYLNDIFLAKLDGTGNLVWGFSLGANKNDEGLDVLTDAGGNIYLCGEFTGTVDFDPGAGSTTLTSTFSGGQMFVAKYSPAGALLWAKHIASITHGDNAAIDIDLDGSGNVYMAGYFQGTIDLDPGAGTVTASDGGGTSMCIVKLTSAGDYVMGFAVGNALLVRSIDVDAGGDIVTTGHFLDPSDMDPSAGTALLTAQGFSDIFVAKYSTAGAHLWSHRLGSANMDNSDTEMGASVRFLSGGDIALVGQFRDTYDANPGAGTLNLTSAGSTDIFLTRFTGAGIHVWTNQYGNNTDDRPHSMAVDAADNIYFGVKMFGYYDLDPGPGTITFTNFDASTTLLTTTSGGSYIGHYQTLRPSSAYEVMGELNFTPAGDLVFAGRFLNTVNCDSAMSPANAHVAVGGADAIIAGFGPTVVSNSPSALQGSVKVGPIPFRRSDGILHVISPSPIHSVRLLSLSGGLLVEQTFQGEKEVDLVMDGALPAGNYLLEVKTREMMHVQKVIVQ